MGNNKQQVVRQAAQWIKDADCVLVASGAGMGVDSGLGTFRGRNAGVWPPLAGLGLDFTDLSCPSWFKRDPRVGWAFWQFRYVGYTGSTPHQGYALVRQWAQAKPLSPFCITSNIDGHWIRCGFPPSQVLEVHGSLLQSQCSTPCSRRIWDTPGDVVRALRPNESGERVHGDLPACPHCRAVARPNVLMFGDGTWIEDRCDAQERAMDEWSQKVQGRNVVVIEIGAGTAVPTIRYLCEKFVGDHAEARLVRINLDQSHVPDHLAARSANIPMGALDALRAIAAHL